MRPVSELGEESQRMRHHDALHRYASFQALILVRLEHHRRDIFLRPVRKKNDDIAGRNL